jgi:hypothetical protein
MGRVVGLGRVVVVRLRRRGLGRRRGVMRRLAGVGARGCGCGPGRVGRRRMLAGSGALSRTLLWFRSVGGGRRILLKVSWGGERDDLCGVGYAMVRVRRTIRLAGGIWCMPMPEDARPLHAAR